MLIAWIICILLTLIVAIHNNRNAIGWLLLSILLGPVALLIVYILPKHENCATPVSHIGHYSSTAQDLKTELESIKNSINTLNNRLVKLEVTINALQGKESVLKPVPMTGIPNTAAPSISHVADKSTLTVSDSVLEFKKPARRTDLERDLGKFWLNRIGIIIFSLGVAFLITHTFRFFGPEAKIFFGYLLSAVLFIIGLKVGKKEKFVNYSRVLLGGAWAIVYFTTYAMYHFEPSKIISNPFLDVFFLSLVALGIIAHSLKFKSETLTAVALFIGYITSTLSDVGYFSLISAGLLALVALVLVYKMQWIKLIFLGIVLTYLTHLTWVVKQISFSLVPVSRLNVENAYFFMDTGFLSIYWFMFTLAIHLIKRKEDGLLQDRLSAANFSNFLFFFFMTYPKLYVFYPAQKLNFVLGLGVFYLVLALIQDRLKRSKLFVSNIIIAVSLLTMSVPLKFLPYHTTIIWFIELPLLLFIGLHFNRRIYRYISCGLSLLLFYKILIFDRSLSGNLQSVWLSMNWTPFLSSMGVFSSALCFLLYRWTHEKSEINAWEKVQTNIFSAFTCTYLIVFLQEVASPLWLTLGFSLESLLVFIVGVLLLDKYLRWYALMILLMGGMRFCLIDRYYGVTVLIRWILVAGPLVCAFIEYGLYHRLHKQSRFIAEERVLCRSLFIGAAAWLIFALVVYVPHIWVTLGLGITALLVLLWGVSINDKYMRGYSLLVALLFAIRFCFIDSYFAVSAFTQWILIFSKLACGYALYGIYRMHSNKPQGEEYEKLLISPLFYGTTFLAVWMIFAYVKDIWVSVSLGMLGGLFFVLGFLMKERTIRHGGFILFAITLARVISVDLAGLPIIYKIISFIILGILFLAVSFIYTKFYIDKKK